MSYNGSGTFNINSTGQPVVAGTVITASAFNALTTDLATGLTTAITKDGQTTTTARITFAQGITSSLTTDSSSVSTGSIITAGGAGIAKNLYVGVNANVAGTLGVTGVATFSAAPIYSSLTASSAVATDASKGLVSVTNTGTGNNVLATSPTITTPTISSLSSASATALTLQSAGTTAITVDTSQQVGVNRTPSAGGGPLQVGFDSSGSAAVRIQTTNASTAGEILNFINSSNTSSGKVIYGASQTSVVYQTTTAGQSTGATLVLNGVAFPATQVASSDANTLDDYEEGTWTPVDASGAGLSLTGSSGRYVKIGNTVFVNAYVNYPVTSNGAAVSFGGLPFTVANIDANHAGNIGLNGTGKANLFPFVGPNLTTVYFRNESNANFYNVNISGTYFQFTSQYVAA